jgi:transcriptional regulator with XRE-family HTH domain
MPSNDRTKIANEVRAELARQQKTQRDAADILGLPQQSVQMRLKGKTAFRAEELAALAVGLGVPVSRFFPETVAAA